jgi:hypothetical protein
MLAMDFLTCLKPILARTDSEKHSPGVTPPAPLYYPSKTQLEE